MAVSVDERHAAIELQEGVSCDDRQRSETIVRLEVRNVQEIVRTYGRATDRHFTRAFKQISREAVFRLDPPPAVVDEADQGSRTSADLSGEFSEGVVCELGRCIQDFVQGEGCQSARLVRSWS